MVQLVGKPMFISKIVFITDQQWRNLKEILSLNIGFFVR